MTVGRTDTTTGSSAVTCPKLPALTTPDPSHLRDGEADGLTAGEMIEDLELVEADLSGGDLSALVLLSCRPSGVFTNNTDLAAARLADCRLKRPSTTYPHSPRFTRRTVELVDFRIRALELYDADVGSLLIEDCRLGLMSLAGTTVRDLLIRAIRTDELDLSGIDTQRVCFEDCQVGTLRLHGGSLSNVDLRRLEMRTANGVDSLAGVTINSGQLNELVSLLAQHLRLWVMDQDHAQNTTIKSKCV